MLWHVAACGAAVVVRTSVCASSSPAALRLGPPRWHWDTIRPCATPHPAQLLARPPATPPPLPFPPPGQLAITYLDEDLRISRGDKGNLFVLDMADRDARL
jgi:hypothetical protein